MSDFKQVLFTNWHLMRWIRLVAGIATAVQAAYAKDVPIGILAVFFLFQSLTNTGCCGGGACSVSLPKEKEK